MTYTNEQKKKIYAHLPDELKEAIISVETFEAIEEIGKKHSLMLDQVSEIGDEVNLLILGLTQQEDFVKNISQRLEIDENKAYAISKDINSNILDKIRSFLRKNSEENNIDSEQSAIKTPPPLPQQNFGPTKLEQEGQFHIEPKAPPSSSPQYNDTNLDREAILKEIEDAQHPTMIDHLLTTPINNAQKVEEKKVVEIAPEEKTIVDKKENQPPKPYTVDPYREPFA